MNRRAPEAGYRFGTKAQWRRTSWKTHRDEVMFTWGTRAEAHCLLMPSIEGIEVDVALANGFRQRNLHVSDYSAGICADLKKRYPLITTYSGDVYLACERIAKKGIKLSVASLDLTGCLSKQTTSTLGLCVESGCFMDGAVIGVNVLRGRERGEVADFVTKGKLWKQVTPPRSGNPADETNMNDEYRLMLIRAALIRPAERIKYGKYRSAAGHQTMLWSIWRLSA